MSRFPPATHRISIAMASYDGAPYVKEQLESFARQTRLPDEVVVCDDGSRDETVQVIRDFSRSVPFEVRVYENERNLGYAANFGRAVSLTTGDLIAFSDQDDVWFPQKLERVEAHFRSWPDTWVLINDARITDGALAPSPFTLFGQNRSAGEPESSLVTGCCTTIRRELVPLLVPVPAPVHSHDQWAHALGRLLGARALLEEPLQFYRRHASATTGWVTTGVQRATPWKLALRQWGRRSLGTDPREACRVRMSQVSVLIDRLTQHRERVGGLLPDGLLRVDQAVASLQRTLMENGQRLRVLDRPLPSRALSALQLYRAGGYRPFEGWKSLAKDVLR